MSDYALNEVFIEGKRVMGMLDPIISFFLQPFTIRLIHLFIPLHAHSPFFAFLKIKIL